MKRPLLFAILFLGLTTVAAQDRPLPDYESFAAQVRMRLATDEQRQSGYMFLERRTEEKVDAAGHPQHEAVKVYEVYPGLPGQERYRRLVEEDGKPVPPSGLSQQDRDRQKTVETYAKKLATPAGFQEETRRDAKERADYRAAVDDLFRLYDIRMVRREPIEGQDTIMATLAVRPGVKPQTEDGKIMRHFTARAWVSESDYELVRVEIEAIDDLSFGWGLLARVHKGTTATYQRRKVNNEVWLPERVTWNGSGRMFLVHSLRLRGVEEFSGYRKFVVDASTTYASPPP